MLAATLGMTVGELDERMGAAEFAEWLALLRVEPWGPYRADLTGAIGAWAVAAPWSKETKVSDFLPKFGEKESDKPNLERLRAYLLALGGKPRGKSIPGQCPGGLSGAGSHSGNAEAGGGSQEA